MPTTSRPSFSFCCSLSCLKLRVWISRVWELLYRKSCISQLPIRFCRPKRHKNFKMKRNPRKVNWTKAYRRLHGKDLTQDSTFEFERKRNRPERYDRNLAENTLKAIKKIDKVRVEREDIHHIKRMKDSKAEKHKIDMTMLNLNIALVKASAGIQKEMQNVKVKVSQALAEDRMQE